MCDKSIEGSFIASRVKTIFNTETKVVNEYLNDIEYEIVKLNDSQYLTKQTNLNSGSIISLMFFKSNPSVGYLSSSDSGIDNLFFNDNGELVHNWSIPIDTDNNLTNAHAILKRINRH